MIVAETFEGARAASAGLVGLVPTMGFLHEGHLSLIEAARRESETVTMSLYVNPLQFDDASDLDRYPVDVERDLALAEEAGVDVVFAPSPDEMFAEAPATAVDVPAFTETMEGAHRPGHFRGVATVVTKLFAGLQPDRAYFGRKDAQQLAVVRRLVADLSFPIDVLGLPIVREHDGLALSSRNVFVTGAGRVAALALSEALRAAVDSVESGERDANALVEVARKTLADAPGLDVDYVELAAQDDTSHPAVLDRPAFLAVAGSVGSVRLIDNVHFDLTEGEVSADLGIRLSGPSILYETGPPD